MILLIALVIAGPLNYFFEKISYRKGKLKPMKEYSFEAFRIIANQDKELPLISGQGKIIAGSWFMFCFLSQGKFNLLISKNRLLFVW